MDGVDDHRTIGGIQVGFELYQSHLACGLCSKNKFVLADAQLHHGADPQQHFTQVVGQSSPLGPADRLVEAFRRKAHLASNREGVLQLQRLTLQQLADVHLNGAAGELHQFQLQLLVAHPPGHQAYPRQLAP